MFSQKNNQKLILVGGMSRSGTTLLSAMLDAHPRISAGAELIPAPIDSVSSFSEHFESAVQPGKDLFQIGRDLRKAGYPLIASVVIRSYRAGISLSGFQSFLDKLTHSGQHKIASLESRFDFAAEIIRTRQVEENTEFASFKLNSPSAPTILKNYPNAHILCIVRHPGDVITSHFKNNFKKTIDQICDAWNNYTRSFLVGVEKFPTRCSIIRYEDLVSDPRTVLSEFFENLPLTFHDNMMEFQSQHSKILNSGHPNSDQLKQGVQLRTVDAKSWDFDPNVAFQSCGDLMTQLGYSFDDGLISKLQTSI